jgi:hypothetical protein
VHSSLLSAATLLQSQLGGERGPNGRPAFSAFAVPIPASDGDLVISRSAPAGTVTAALGLDDPAKVPDTIAAHSLDRSLALLRAEGIDAVRVCPDPARLASDPWAARKLYHDRCAFVRPPWTFTD